MSTRKSRCQVRKCVRNVNVSMHQLPKKLYLRDSWIKRLKLCFLDSSPDRRFRVCREHFRPSDFIDGKGSKVRHLHMDAVPSINLPNDFCSKHEMCQLMTESSSEHDGSIESHLKDDEKPGSFSEENNSIELLSEHEMESTDRQWLNSDDEMTIEMDFSSGKEVVLDVNEGYKAKVHYEEVKSPKSKIAQEDKSIQTNLRYEEAVRHVTLRESLRSDSDLQSWTGLPGFVTLNNIVKCIQKISAAQNQLKKLKASSETLTILVMTKLKTNLSFKQLSCLFSLKPSTLSNYFDEFIPILKAVLEPAIFWPTNEQVAKNLPKCFLPSFRNCRAVMDCTEFPIISLKSLESRIKNHSHYKGYQTGKANITATPSGLVTALSRAWGGKASDKYIVLKQKILEMFSSGEGVMVDKGYSIERETADKGIHLYRPPILDKPQHTRQEAIYNTNVATSRIHIERVIQRLKIFEMFKSKMNRSILKYIDDILFICCAITNLSNPVLADDKF